MPLPFFLERARISPHGLLSPSTHSDLLFVQSSGERDKYTYRPAIKQTASWNTLVSSRIFQCLFLKKKIKNSRRGQNEPRYVSCIFLASLSLSRPSPPLPLPTPARLSFCEREERDSVLMVGECRPRASMVHCHGTMDLYTYVDSVHFFLCLLLAVRETLVSSTHPSSISASSDGFLHMMLHEPRGIPPPPLSLSRARAHCCGCGHSKTTIAANFMSGRWDASHATRSRTHADSDCMQHD